MAAQHPNERVKRVASSNKDVKLAQAFMERGDLHGKSEDFAKCQI